MEILKDLFQSASSEVRYRASGGAYDDIFTTPGSGVYCNPGTAGFQLYCPIIIENAEDLGQVFDGRPDEAKVHAWLDKQALTFQCDTLCIFCRDNRLSDNQSIPKDAFNIALGLPRLVMKDQATAEKMFKDAVRQFSADTELTWDSYYRQEAAMMPFLFGATVMKHDDIYEFNAFLRVESANCMKQYLLAKEELGQDYAKYAYEAIIRSFPALHEMRKPDFLEPAVRMGM